MPIVRRGKHCVVDQLVWSSALAPTTVTSGVTFPWDRRLTGGVSIRVSLMYFDACRCLLFGSTVGGRQLKDIRAISHN